MLTIKTAVIGATGYTGAELVRILSGHPEVELVALTTRSYAGKPVWEVYPHLYKYSQMVCEEMDLPELLKSADALFIALPHGHSMMVAAEALRQGKKVIDLGADFRLKDYRVYEKWYKMEHFCKDILPEAVYGLPELNREKIRKTSLLANPGCYPTSAILALAPLLRHNLVDTSSIIIDAKSGVSGAGRGLSLGTHYCEVNDNFRPYNVAVHRHTPEIEQELGNIAGKDITVSFTPHLLPLTRGILSTVYAALAAPLDQEQARHLYLDFYQDEFFVRLLPPGMLPQTKWVAGTNHCDINLVVDPRSNRIIVLAAIDNLGKGAAGQAVQNMNIMYGLAEAAALDVPACYP